VSELTTGGSVRVRTPAPDRLAAALDSAGLSITRRDGELLLVNAEDSARIGELAHSAGVPLHELTPVSTSLEEVFLELTSDTGGIT
jgi:ABC-2 type transport system ATP-binding protein